MHASILIIPWPSIGFEIILNEIPEPYLRYNQFLKNIKISISFLKHILAGYRLYEALPQSWHQHFVQTTSEEDPISILIP